MSKKEFKQKNKLAIAEFVNAKHTSTLIVSDVEKCVKALGEEAVITNAELDSINRTIEKNPNDAVKLINEALTRISNEVGGSIMQEYYSGKL